MLLSQGELAQAFQVTTRTIRAWEGEGMPALGSGREKRYSLPEAVAWRVDQLRAADMAELASDAPTKAVSDARIAHAKAQLLEIEVQERAGQLVPLAAYDQVLVEVFAKIRTRILNFPGRWAPELVGFDSPRQVHPVLSRMARELLEDLSGPAADELEAGGPSGEIPEGFPGRSALVESGITLLDQVRGVEDLTEIRGIGAKTAAAIRSHMEAHHAV